MTQGPLNSRQSRGQWDGTTLSSVPESPLTGSPNPPSTRDLTRHPNGTDPTDHGSTSHCTVPPGSPHTRSLWVPRWGGSDGRPPVARTPTALGHLVRRVVVAVSGQVPQLRTRRVARRVVRRRRDAPRPHVVGGPGPVGVAAGDARVPWTKDRSAGRVPTKEEGP